MARVTRGDWLEAALPLLVGKGPAALTIGALCRRLGVTKGSFYHHFASFGDFKTSFLAYFEQEGTLSIIEAVEAEATPLTKLHRLLSIVVAHSEQVQADPEVALRAWALQDEEVRAVQQRIDARRMGYVRHLLEQITVKPDEAEQMARLLYTLLIGAEHMQPPVRGDALRALFDDYLRLYSLHE